MATSPNPPTVVRPKRFALRLPVEFRPQNSERWSRATTENISANGILFRTRQRIAPLTPVDLKMQLPPVLTGEGTVRLLCSGYVVRAVEPRLPFGKTRIAATFLDYQVSNGKPGVLGDLRHAQLLASRSEVARQVHRLNNLLSIMLGSADLLLMERGTRPEVRNHAAAIRDAAEEAATVVRSLAKTMK